MAVLDTTETQKQAAAIAAVGEVERGMIVGLGTGTTAAYAIAALARHVAGGLNVRAVATSRRTAQAASAAGIEILDFSRVDTIDLAIDGVDEIDPAFRAIKGGGGAMLREKIVAEAALRMIAIADAAKSVAWLGSRPVPLEVLPFACALVLSRVRDLGCVPSLRQAGTQPFFTDQDNLVIDCHFDALSDLQALATSLSAIPGVLGHGLFLGEIDTVYLGTSGGVARRDRPIIL